MKYPDTYVIITRLMKEAGYVSPSGGYDRKRFCKDTGVNPRTLNNYLSGQTSISQRRLRKLLATLGVKIFNIAE